MGDGTETRWLEWRKQQIGFRCFRCEKSYLTWTRFIRHIFVGVHRDLTSPEKTSLINIAVADKSERDKCK